jgi:hypothetical protein
MVRGSAPSKPDKGGTAIVAVAAPTASEDSGNCKTPSKYAIPITTCIAFVPYRSGDTNARCGCGGGPVGDMVSACRLKMSLSEGRSTGGREWGGGVTSPSSPSSSPHEDSGLEGVSPPPHTPAAARLDGSSPIDTVGLLSHHILR